MEVLDVPIFNADGSVQFTQKLSPNEAQALLGFALNFLTAHGFMTQVSPPETEQELND
jgi:hypothetical protein